MDKYNEEIAGFKEEFDDYKRQNYERIKKEKGLIRMTRLETIKYDRAEWEFSSVEEQKVHELAILNDTLALIYDYISEKK